MNKVEFEGHLKSWWSYDEWDLELDGESLEEKLIRFLRPDVTSTKAGMVRDHDFGNVRITVEKLND